jgi:pimeloyl-ACP methyl ester carboxylesterase
MAKEKLILIPGMLCDERLWGHQVNGVAGLADATVWMPVGAESIADLAKRLLAEAPERFALAGLSMGGYIALEIARIAPERLTRLALMDTTPLPDSPERTTFRRQTIERAERGEFEAFYGEMLLPRLIHTDRLSDAALVATVRGMAMSLGAGVFIQQTRAVMSRPNYVAVLPGIRCPTVVVCGKQDAICPVDDHRLMAETIPGASLVAIDECGHLASIERPYAVTSVLQYWLQ